MAQATIINTIGTDYRDYPQDEAAGILGKVGTSINAAAKTAADKEYHIGHLLNRVHDSGLAVAASDAPTDKEGLEMSRDYSNDGRTTAVSRFTATIANLDTKKVSAYRKIAFNRDALTTAGIDTKQFVDSTFRNLQKDADMDTFIEVVETLMADPDTKKVTQAAFNAAGREAGIVKTANNGSASNVDELQTVLNAALVAIKKADTLTKANFATIGGIIEAANEKVTDKK